MNNPSTIRLVIADDHEIFRDGLRALLQKDPGITIVAEAADGQSLIGICSLHQPDVVLTDMIMPGIDGVRAIEKITKAPNPPKCIALSIFNNNQMVVDALEAGALGYVVKNAEKGEIAEAVKTVNDGQPYYCRSTEAKLKKLIIQSNFNPYKRIKGPAFSEKEIEIIKLICEEKTSAEIGAILHLGTRTVEGYRLRILDKMKVKTSTGVAIYAIKNFLYHID